MEDCLFDRPPPGEGPAGDADPTIPIRPVVVAQESPTADAGTADPGAAQPSLDGMAAEPDDEPEPSRPSPSRPSPSRPSRSPRHAEPLAARMRPRTVAEYVGQADVLGDDSALRALLEQGELTSLVMWGPPGSGKTSLAAVIANNVDAAWRELSAVTAGVKDVRQVIDQARTRREATGRRTVLFIDEIHRFNKAQQDALLPAVEHGWVILVGATTENPFFELNGPLLSRCTLVQLDPLSRDDLRVVLHRALADEERGLAGRVALTDAAEHQLLTLGDGDARAMLNALEAAAKAVTPGDDGRVHLDRDDVRAAVRNYRYDRAGDQHYDQVSAFIKSLRGSDPDAAVYWLLRMLAGGEDPRFVARRMVIFASEDVGLADRDALPIAVAAFDALDKVGLPEARYHLTHAALYLATARKSDSVKRALGAGQATVERAPNAPVPGHLRDAHYSGARELGHGAGYAYPHDHPGAFVAQQYLPDEVAGQRVFEPTDHGDEAAIAERVAGWRAHAAGTAHEQTTE